MTMLVRTPAPFQTESLFGFVLRVSEANGYESPRYVWELAQVPRGAEMAPRLPVDGLARILGQASTGLESIAYRSKEGGRGSYKILAHPLGDDLRGGPLRLRNPALCPRCVAEEGYVDAFWDLTAAVACPVHTCKVVRDCPTCRSPITWLRPGLLTCHCGASFTTATVEPADADLCELMALLQARLHNRRIEDAHSTSGLPIEFLAVMPFSALIRMLAALGTQALQACGVRADSSGRTITEAVSIVTNWPHGYHRFLSQLGSKGMNEQPDVVGLRKQFAGFYQAMFRNLTFSTHAAFLREEFIRFGQQHWGKAVVDGKFFRGRGQKAEGRFLPKSEVARRFRIWKPMMDRMIADGTLVTTRIGTGRCARIVGIPCQGHGTAHTGPR
jgi:TniQ